MLSDLKNYRSNINKVRGAILLEFAILLAIAFSFVYVSDLFEPVGKVAQKNIENINGDAYNYGGRPVNQGKKDEKPALPPLPFGDKEYGAGNVSVIEISSHDTIKENMSFVDASEGKYWKEDEMGKGTASGKIKYFSIETLLGFNPEKAETYEIFFNNVPNTDATNYGLLGDYQKLEMQLICYEYINKEYVPKVLSFNNSTGDNYYRIGDDKNKFIFTVDSPCYIAINIRGESRDFHGLPNLGSSFLTNYCKIKKVV